MQGGITDSKKHYIHFHLFSLPYNVILGIVLINFGKVHPKNKYFFTSFGSCGYYAYCFGEM